MVKTNRIAVALSAVNPTGLVAQRLTFSDFTDCGLHASNTSLASYGESTAVINSISDISVNLVSGARRSSSLYNRQAACVRTGLG